MACDKGVTVEVEFETGIVPAEIAIGRITELRAPLAGHRLRVHLSRNGLPVATLPDAWLDRSGRMHGAGENAVVRGQTFVTKRATLLWLLTAALGWAQQGLSFR